MDSRKMKKVFEFTGNAAMLALFTVVMLEANHGNRGEWQLEWVFVYPILGFVLWKLGFVLWKFVKFMGRLIFRKETWIWLWKNLI